MNLKLLLFVYMTIPCTYASIEYTIGSNGIVDNENIYVPEHSQLSLNCTTEHYIPFWRTSVDNVEVQHHAKVKNVGQFTKSAEYTFNVTNVKNNSMVLCAFSSTTFRVPMVVNLIKWPTLKFIITVIDNNSAIVCCGGAKYNKWFKLCLNDDCSPRPDVIKNDSLYISKVYKLSELDDQNFVCKSTFVNTSISRSIVSTSRYTFDNYNKKSSNPQISKVINTILNFINTTKHQINKKIEDDAKNAPPLQIITYLTVSSILLLISCIILVLFVCCGKRI